MKTSRAFVGLCISHAIWGQVAFADQHGSGVVDSYALYALQPNQVFKDEPTLKLTVGFIEGGDEVAYQTWRGKASGKNVYLEIHGDSVRIKTGKQSMPLKFSSAHRWQNEEKAELDPMATSLFVHSAKKASDSLICLESMPLEEQLTAPIRSVFVITHALTRPVLHQLPAIYGSCRGLVFERGQGVAAPYWIREFSSSSRFTIQYLPLIDTGFGGSTGKQTVVTNPGNEIDRFEIESP